MVGEERRPVRPQHVEDRRRVARLAGRAERRRGRDRRQLLFAERREPGRRFRERAELPELASRQVRGLGRAARVALREDEAPERVDFFASRAVLGALRPRRLRVEDADGPVLAEAAGRRGQAVVAVDERVEVVPLLARPPAERELSDSLGSRRRRRPGRRARGA